MYKNRPLVRCGNKIYYGNMADGYVCELTIQEAQDERGLKMSKKILVHLLCTAPDCPPQEMVVSKSDKNNLADALEIASIWLERKLAE